MRNLDRIEGMAANSLITFVSERTARDNHQSEDCKKAVVRSDCRNAPVATLRAALGDRVGLLDPIVVGRPSGAVHPAARGVGASPNLAQGPVAEQVPVQVNLVVAGCIRIDPGVALRVLVHAGQSRRCSGSSGEPAKTFDQVGWVHDVHGV
jgi:hypothetical protein